MNRFFAALTGLGPLGVFAVATLDSAGIPLPMGVDALLVTVAILSPPQAYLGALLATAGSAAGNTLLYCLARRGGEGYLRRQTESPRARRFSQWFQRYGLITVFVPTIVPVVPLPLKVFVLTAGATRVSFRAFLATIVAGRIPRFLGLAYLGAQVGENSFEWLKGHSPHLAAAAGGLLVVLWVLVKLAERRGAGRAPETPGGGTHS